MLGDDERAVGLGVGEGFLSVVLCAGMLCCFALLFFLRVQHDVAVAVAVACPCDACFSLVFNVSLASVFVATLFRSVLRTLV